MNRRTRQGLVHGQPSQWLSARGRGSYTGSEGPPDGEEGEEEGSDEEDLEGLEELDDEALARRLQQREDRAHYRRLLELAGVGEG